MPDPSGAALSVAGLFAERDAIRRRDQEADAQLQKRKEEELHEFRKRLDDFQLTETVIHSTLDKIKRAFDHGETELMIVSFPSSFCTDNGRAISNAGVAPINKPTAAEIAAHPDPEWLDTMPAGVLPVYHYWRDHLRPGGFHLIARIIDYPGGKPGDVGLFFSWPKDAQ
jgi:hypothetical protein